MTPERWRRIEELYHAALTRGEHDRPAFWQTSALATQDPTARGRIAAGAAGLGSWLSRRSRGGRRGTDGHDDQCLGPDRPTSWAPTRCRRARRGRDGRSLSRARHQARARRRHQDPAAAFTSDPERLARFEREARCSPHSIIRTSARSMGWRDADGVRALVLELVEGETLADRIARGPIPVRRGADASRDRSPTRSTRRTRRASSTGI